jgi:serine/threonine protein kinase
MTVYTVNSPEVPLQARVSFRETVEVCEDKVAEGNDSSLPSASTFTTVWTGSESSLRSGGSSTQQKYDKLRGNLTRQQLNRDPFFFYEVTKVLGEGSMGSVKLVRKRRNKIGGSARRDIQDAVKQQKRNQDCLNIPLVGGIFRFCVDANLKDSDREVSVRSVESATTLSGRSFSNIFSTKEDMLALSNTSDVSVGSSSVGSISNGITYAMKSIILSHVSRQEFVDELRNEIAVMKSLDHPHIVR